MPRRLAEDEAALDSASWTLGPYPHRVFVDHTHPPYRRERIVLGVLQTTYHDADD